MGKLSLCILDDKIPVERLTDIQIDDTSYIDGNILKHCLTLQNEAGEPYDWGDESLRNFVDAIKDDADYSISGFKNHLFFFNHKEDVIFSPDIIVFDWDMGDGGQDSSTNLLKLLSSTYCLVAIFTGEDAEDGVSELLNKPEFKEYQCRCFLIKKQDEDSANSLKNQIKEHEKDFSFEFGNEFRKASLSALNEILVELGIATSNELRYYFNIEDDNDLKGLMSEKYNVLLNSNGNKFNYPKGSKWAESLLHVVRKKFEKRLSSLNVLNINKEEVNPVDNNIIEKLWSYRLYHKYPDLDKNIRKGDIICNNEQYYLIINSDCHLPRLWAKNFGFVNVIPLLLVDNTNQKLRDIFDLLNNGISRDYKQNSFSETMSNFSEGAFCMPFVPVNGIHKTFLFFAKNLTYIQVATPNVVKGESVKSKKFTYDLFTNHTRICTLSEPFLTPIITNVLSAIAGHGCPDYSNATKELLNNKIKQIFS